MWGNAPNQMWEYTRETEHEYEYETGARVRARDEPRIWDVLAPPCHTLALDNS